MVLEGAKLNVRIKQKLADKKVFFIKIFCSLLLAVPMLVIIFPEKSASENSNRMLVSQEYAAELAEGKIYVNVSGDLYSFDEIGVKVQSRANNPQEKLRGMFNEIVHDSEFVWVDVNSQTFELFLRDLNSKHSVLPKNASLERGDDGKFVVSDGENGRVFNSNEVLGSIFCEIGSENSQIGLGSTPEKPAIAAADLEGQLEYFEKLTGEIYVMYGGVTIVLSERDVANFLLLDCGGSECDVAVDRASVDVFAKGRLAEIFDRTSEMKQLHTYAYRADDNVADVSQASREIISMLNLRMNVYGGEVVLGAEAGDEQVPENIIMLGGIEAPGTGGGFASKYLEVDDSQQHIYAWENGRVVMDFEISGFYEGWDFFGEYSILNKAENAWSPIAEKWMPFWMAYHYDKEQEAWLGIHELTQWTDDDGVWHEESSENVGLRKSTGCLRLDRGESEELYNWTEVGVPLLVHR